MFTPFTYGIKTYKPPIFKWISIPYREKKYDGSSTLSPKPSGEPPTHSLTYLFMSMTQSHWLTDLAKLLWIKMSQLIDWSTECTVEISRSDGQKHRLRYCRDVVPKFTSFRDSGISNSHMVCWKIPIFDGFSMDFPSHVGLPEGPLSTGSFSASPSTSKIPRTAARQHVARAHPTWVLQGRSQSSLWFQFQCFNKKNWFFLATNSTHGSQETIDNPSLQSVPWIDCLTNLNGQVTLAVNIPQPPLPCCCYSWRCPSLGLECGPWLWKCFDNRFAVWQWRLPVALSSTCCRWFPS